MLTLSFAVYPFIFVQVVFALRCFLVFILNLEMRPV